MDIVKQNTNFITILNKSIQTYLCCIKLHREKLRYKGGASSGEKSTDSTEAKTEEVVDRKRGKTRRSAAEKVSVNHG